MIDAAQDLILWQWPLKVVVTVAFYAFAVKGLERLLRNIVSISVRLKRFIADSEAVDYSVERRDWSGGNGRKSVFWELFTWWITRYDQRQRRPLDVKVLDMPRDPASGGTFRPFAASAPNFGPDEPKQKEQPE